MRDIDISKQKKDALEEFLHKEEDKLKKEKNYLSTVYYNCTYTGNIGCNQACSECYYALTDEQATEETQKAKKEIAESERLIAMCKAKLKSLDV